MAPQRGTWGSEQPGRSGPPDQPGLPAWSGRSHPDGATLSAYVDGELAGASRLSIDRHLRECAACRGIVAAYKNQSDLFQRVPTQRVPMSLRRDMYRRIAEKEDHRRRFPLLGWLRLPNGAVLLNGAALLVTVALLLVLVPQLVAAWRAADTADALPSAAEPVIPLSTPAATPEVPTPIPPTATSLPQQTASAIPPTAVATTPAARASVTVTGAASPSAAATQAGQAPAAPGAAARATGSPSPAAPTSIRPTATSTSAAPRLVSGIAGRVTEVDRRKGLLTVTTAETPARTWQITLFEGTQFVAADGRRLGFEDLGLSDQVDVSGSESAPGTVMASRVVITLSSGSPAPATVRSNRVLVLLDGVESLRPPQFGFTGDWVKRLNDTGYAVTALEPSRITGTGVNLQDFGLIVIGYPATMTDAALRAVQQSKASILLADPRLVQPLGLGLNLDPQAPTRNVAGSTVEVAAGSASPVLKGLSGELALAGDTLYRMPIVPTGTTLATITDNGRKQAVWSQNGSAMYFGFWYSNTGQNHTAQYWTLFDRSVLSLLGRDPLAPPPVRTAVPTPTR